MKILSKQQILVSFLFVFWSSFAQALPHGFVYLHEVDPTILVSMRYCGMQNFLGRAVEGYKRPVVILTEQAAQALKLVQQRVRQDGYSLVVYDAYRPQRAVNNFVDWSCDCADQCMKSLYYPHVDKSCVFELGYVAQRSGHSRGSTVDLTLMKLNQNLHEVSIFQRQFADGTIISVLDDGTVDMGSSFDLFDPVSHYENNLITQEQQRLRAYLKDVMEAYGFKNYTQEWWHFTLKNEPFPADQDSSYFDFEIE